MFSDLTNDLMIGTRTNEFRIFRELKCMGMELTSVGEF